MKNGNSTVEFYSDIEKISIFRNKITIYFMLRICYYNTMKNKTEKNGYKLLSVGGDLKRRLLLNVDRMNSEEYAEKNVYKPASYEWYGDWEGRALLAVTSLGKYFDEISERRDMLWAALDKHLNKDGYFGPIVDGNSVNEQQYAGNGWFLRALCLEYDITGSEEIKEKIRKAALNLFVKSSEEFVKYPIDLNVDEQGGIIGQLNIKYKNWKISSDSGCLYISLDGLAEAYRILKDESILSVADLLIKMMNDTALNNKNFQCHAFLSGVRGIIKFGDMLGEKYYAIAERFYDYFAKANLNAVYEGSGTLGKQTPSEGCAVIDSEMISLRLYLHTGNPKYLGLYRKIVENALRVNQRANGGFGCNYFTGATHPYVEILPEGKEAFWCCTMRGAEGLTDIAENLYSVKGDTIEVLLPSESEVSFFDGKVIIKQKTSYPFTGETKFEIEAERPFKLTIKALSDYDVYIDEKLYNGELLEIKGTSSVTFVMKARFKKDVFEDKYRFFNGDLLLCSDGGEDSCGQSSVISLLPIADFSTIPMETLDNARKRILFSNPSKIRW